jgi:hypothetical protein
MLFVLKEMPTKIISFILINSIVKVILCNELLIGQILLFQAKEGPFKFHNYTSLLMNMHHK